MRAIILILFIISLSFAKPVLINVQKEGCGWCKRMNKEIFKNKKIIKKIESRYKVIVLNRDFDKIPSILRVHFFPTTFILNDDMTKVEDELLGYQKPSQLLEYLGLGSI